MPLRLFVFCLLLKASAGFAEATSSEPVFGDRPGYLFEVREEKDKRNLEMVVLGDPKPAGPPVKDVIFDEKLSREFQSQYEYRFGITAAEQSLNSVTREDGYTFNSGENVTVEQYQDRQKSFGEYMTRRLIEHHVDRWVKNDPAVRPLYEFKEKISNVSVQVKRGYKFRWRYNFAGNYMDMKLENPYDIETKLTVQMNSGGFGPTEPEETILYIAYPLSKKLKIASLYKEHDGVFQLIGTRQLTPRLSTSLTGSVDGKAVGPNTQQNYVLVGLSWRE